MPGTNHPWTKLAVTSAAIAVLSCNSGGGGGGSSGYVQLKFETTISNAQRDAFNKAAARIGKILTAHQSTVRFTGSETCGTGQPGAADYPVPSSVTDLLIFVEVKAIDGVNGVLAISGPCYGRTSNGLPVVGIMSFDVADLNQLETEGLLDDVVLHEMLHVVGFGTIWPSKGLLNADTCVETATDITCPPGADPRYLGTNAADAFKNHNGGTTDTVPLEVTGGMGTALSHWLSTVFGDELMTGYIGLGTHPLSRTSVASLADLGYQVDLTQADPFTIPTTAANVRAQGATSQEPSVFLGGDTLPTPMRLVDDAP